MPHDYQKLNRLIGANAYWQVNKFLAREYGLDVAILLADLVSKGAYFAERDELDPDGYFFNTRESIEEDTTLSPHKQRVAIKALVEAGVLETKSVGIPRKTYYRVVNDKLLKILTTGGEKIQPLEVKKFNGNKNKEIRIKNNGLGSGYAKKVTSTIADGMEYIEDNEINKANGWKLDGKKITTSKYSYETDINNELYPKRYEYEENHEEDTEEKEEEKPELNTGVQKLQLVLKVTKNDKTHDKLLSQIVVEQQDKRGDTVEYTKEDEETSKNRVEMEYTYTDLHIEKRINNDIIYGK